MLNFHKSSFRINNKTFYINNTENLESRSLLAGQMGVVEGFYNAVADVYEHPFANSLGLISGFVGALGGSELIKDLGTHMVKNHPAPAVPAPVVEVPGVLAPAVPQVVDINPIVNELGDVAINDEFVNDFLDQGGDNWQQVEALFAQGFNNQIAQPVVNAEDAALMAQLIAEDLLGQNADQGLMADVLGGVAGFFPDSVQAEIACYMSQHHQLASPLAGGMMIDFIDDLVVKHVKDISADTYDLIDGDDTDNPVYYKKNNQVQGWGTVISEWVGLSAFSYFANTSAESIAKPLKWALDKTPSGLGVKKVINTATDFLPGFKNHIVDHKLGALAQIGVVSPYAAYQVGSVGYEYGLWLDHSLWGYTDNWGIDVEAKGVGGTLAAIGSYIMEGDWTMRGALSKGASFFTKMGVSQLVLGSADTLIESIVSVNPMIQVPVKVVVNVGLTYGAHKGIDYGFDRLNAYIDGLRFGQSRVFEL